ncbi:metallopeptidase MepB [Cordyceps fumosorosea ARSEF 2679]|uniref:Metallopeptidase MepB n=1 Tax=Cordyceps fumosorosea (strain ARSEF 2679) TaxID=1081104 RepID=A0A168D8K3_CORFA|nr:metallopeptidase MepB [Cordyceps fumosorosea ARSEF 2679]OAA72291.1 metallopeptidase MepB [Cordyceps fumosorosea ARSEF 2679]
MDSARYRSPPQPPPLFNGTAESILATINAALDRHRAVLDRVVAQVTPATATFDTVMKPILESENEADKVKWVNGFYQLASPDPALRDASRQVEELIDAFDIECNTREDLFALIDAAHATRHSQGLDGESLHLLEREWQRNVQNGLLLPAGPDRERFREALQEISSLCLAAQKVLDEDTGGVWFRPEELEGIPADAVNIGDLEKGTGENEGKVKVTFKYDHLIPLYTYAIHEATRRTYMLAVVSRANVNAPLFQRIIELRDEAARLVGFDNHAEFRISARMAKTPARVHAMLQTILDLTEDGVRADVAALLRHKQADCVARGAPFDGTLHFWDRLFYSRVRREVEFGVDEAAVAQYFPVGPTVAAMLAMLGELFGLVFVRMDEEADRARISPTGRAGDVAWHPDASLYSVWDDDDDEQGGGAFCGYLYLDLHPRDGKYGHDACFTLQSGFTRPDGRPFHPSAALLCNLPGPAAEGSKPALLHHADVVTVLHELGHAVHCLAARSTHARARDVAADFLEAPSQMLENWCWTPSALRRLSGVPIPEELVARLVAARGVNAALDARDAAHTALFDMRVHSGESPAHVRGMDCGRLWNELRTDLTGLHGPGDMGMDWGNGHLIVDHFITGYDAGYYGYLFSEVFSADMFHAAFKQDPMDGAQGRRYRHLVLERAGTMDEMQCLIEFLGREPDPRAFFEDRGLTKS